MGNSLRILLVLPNVPRDEVIPYSLHRERRFTVRGCHVKAATMSKAYQQQHRNLFSHHPVHFLHSSFLLANPLLEVSFILFSSQMGRLTLVGPAYSMSYVLPSRSRSRMIYISYLRQKINQCALRPHEIRYRNSRSTQRHSIFSINIASLNINPSISIGSPRQLYKTSKRSGRPTQTPMPQSKG